VVPLQYSGSYLNFSTAAIAEGKLFYWCKFL